MAGTKKHKKPSTIVGKKAAKAEKGVKRNIAKVSPATGKKPAVEARAHSKGKQIQVKPLNLKPLDIRSSSKFTSSKAATPIDRPAEVSGARDRAVISPKTPIAARAVSDKSSIRQLEKAKAALKRENVGAETMAPKPSGKAGKSRRISVDANPNEAASALSQKWTSLYKKAEQIDAKPYNMRAVFEEKTAIMHKVLGWGYILANRNDRLEVLFKDGIKYLISNYKP